MVLDWLTYATLNVGGNSLGNLITCQKKLTTKTIIKRFVYDIFGL